MRKPYWNDARISYTEYLEDVSIDVFEGNVDRVIDLINKFKETYKGFKLTLSVEYNYDNPPYIYLNKVIEESDGDYNKRKAKYEADLAKYEEHLKNKGLSKEEREFRHYQKLKEKYEGNLGSL